MPGVPRIGFSIVDVRDVADLQIRAMTAPEAGGERFIAVSPLRSGCRRSPRSCATGSARRRRRCPTRTVPDLVVRAMGLFDPGVRSIVGQLGRKLELLEREGRIAARLVAAPDRGDDRRLRPQHGLLDRESTHLALEHAAELHHHQNRARRNSRPPILFVTHSPNRPRTGRTA